MRDLPIPFSAPMVRALLDGRKTQTRRVLKSQPIYHGPDLIPSLPARRGYTFADYLSVNSLYIEACTPYAAGDRLWVREAWRTMDGLDALSGAQIAANCHEAGYPRAWCPIQYEADGARANWLGDPHTFGTKPGRYRHARFMPRWASRLTLLVTYVRVQRLQEISRGDAMEEGCPFPNMAAGPDPRNWFAALWDSLHGNGAWHQNPWVCATTFTVHPANIDTLEAGHA